MRVLTVQLGYIYASEGEEKISKRKQKLRDLGIKVQDATDVNMTNITMTGDQYITWVLSGEEGKVVSEAFITEDHYIRTLERMEHLAAKMETFASSFGATGNAHFNERVEVYTPGMGLMLFNSVMLAEDACTDALQTHLDQGWKIIAACPQPNQRRPDFILGRYDPSRDEKAGINTVAERSRDALAKSIDKACSTIDSAQEALEI